MHRSFTLGGEEQVAINMKQTGHLSGWLQGTAALGGGMGLSGIYGDSPYKSSLNITGFPSRCNTLLGGECTVAGGESLLSGVPKALQVNLRQA